MDKASKKYNLNKADMAKVGKGLFIAAAGAGLTYLMDIVPMVDFGQYTPIAVAVNSCLINLARKWLAGLK